MPCKREENKRRLCLLNISSWLGMLKRVNFFFISLVMLVCSNIIEVSFMKTYKGPGHTCVRSTEVEHNQDILLTKSKSKEKLNLTGKAKGKTEGALYQEQGTLILVLICHSSAIALWLLHRQIQIDIIFCPAITFFKKI